MIVGGGTTVGRIATQFAGLAGVGTIVTTASLSGEAELKIYGATHVIARQTPDVEEQVRSIVGDDLVYILDCSPEGSPQPRRITPLDFEERNICALKDEEGG